MLVAAAEPLPDGTLVNALARAWRWQRMLDKGLYTSVSEIGDAENISKSYVRRTLRLGAEIVEAILAARRITVRERDRCVRFGVMEPWRGLQVNVQDPSVGDGNVWRPLLADQSYGLSSCSLWRRASRSRTGRHPSCGQR